VGWERAKIKKKPTDTCRPPSVIKEIILIDTFILPYTRKVVLPRNFPKT
jgi:hypothetical protein